MDWMHANLVAACEKENYSTVIRATLKIGLNLLNKYYSITDNSEVYRIAMGKSKFELYCKHLTFSLLVLHPTHKLKYFAKQNWDEDWISTAEEIVWEEFRQNYSTYVVHKKKKELTTV